MPTKAELEAKLAEMESTKAEPVAAKPVTIPGLVRFPKANLAIQQDETYSANMNVYRLKSDGDITRKRDGSAKKPTRLRVEQVRGLLNNAKAVAEMCDTIEASQATATTAE